MAVTPPPYRADVVGSFLRPDSVRAARKAHYEDRTLSAEELAAVEDAGGKRLIVGQGIRLAGEITACDRLVVEGFCEVTLNETRALEIAASGRFIGGCEVEEAEISGVYEGELTVRPSEARSGFAQAAYDIMYRYWSAELNARR